MGIYPWFFNGGANLQMCKSTLGCNFAFQALVGENFKDLGNGCHLEFEC